MTPEHTALVARLDRLKAASLRELADDCAAAIRALAGEVEEQERETAEQEKEAEGQQVSLRSAWDERDAALANERAMQRRLTDVLAAVQSLEAEVAAEKGAHWRTCQTAAHEAEERDKLMVENAMLKADPLHMMLMAQATHRLGEIQRLEAEVERWEEVNRQWEMLSLVQLSTENTGLRAEVAGLKATSNQCENECDTLRAEVAALRKDAERLDALERSWAKWGVDSYAKDPSKFGLWWEGDTTDGNEYASLRAAIDAALADKPLSGPTP